MGFIRLYITRYISYKEGKNGIIMLPNKEKRIRQQIRKNPNKKKPDDHEGGGNGYPW